MRRVRHVACIGFVAGALVVCAVWQYPDRTLPVLAEWLDAGGAPTPADYVLVLPGDYNTRPFVAAALIRNGFAQSALVLEDVASPSVEDALLPADCDVVEQVLKRRGVDSQQIIHLTGRSGNTFEDATLLRQFLADKPEVSVTVVTTHYHTRRARWTFQHVLGAQMKQVEIVSAPSDRFIPERWWNYEDGVAAIGGEYVKICAYGIAYGPVKHWLAGGTLLLAGWIGWRRWLGSTARPSGSIEVADTGATPHARSTKTDGGLSPLRSISDHLPEVLPGDHPSPEGWRGSVERALQILRHYHAGQLLHRLANVLRVRLRPFRTLPFIDRGATLTTRHGEQLTPLAKCRLHARTLRDGQTRAREILQGRFHFLNLEQQLSFEDVWNAQRQANLPRLWVFHLQSHEFILDLATLAAESDGKLALDRAWDLVRRWIAAQPVSQVKAADDAWHPYCISKRLVSWILLWQVAPPPDAFQADVLHSLRIQTEFLRRHLEWDVRGNHLLENLRALLIAGSFVDGPKSKRWLTDASSILSRELESQILPHGEHFERSPGYHALMLELVLDVRDAVRESCPELARQCDGVGRSMAEFLRHIARPDGEVPLLADSSQDEIPPLAWLLGRVNDADDSGASAKVEDVNSHPTDLPARVLGGYWVYREGQDWLLFDAAPVGADSLPAHAHADLLNIEISLAGQPLIVDSGVYDYEDSPMRRYCRSTAAHSTVEVDRFDQCDMWSRFRMGYRGYPTPVETGTIESWHWASATHNAYRRQGVPQVGRWVACRQAGPWWIVDWLKGHGSHAIASRLHLHPSVEFEEATAEQMVIRVRNRLVTIFPLVPGQLSVEQGWHCPSKGTRLPTRVIVWRGERGLPFACGWQLGWGTSDSRAELRLDAGGRGYIDWQDQGRLVTIPVHETAKGFDN